MSLEAHGTLGGVLTFRQSVHRSTVAKTQRTVHNPNSDAQHAARMRHRVVHGLYHRMTAAERLLWRSYHPSPYISGYEQFMRVGLNRAYHNSSAWSVPDPQPAWPTPETLLVHAFTDADGLTASDLSDSQSNIDINDGEWGILDPDAPGSISYEEGATPPLISTDFPAGSTPPLSVSMRLRIPTGAANGDALNIYRSSAFTLLLRFRREGSNFRCWHRGGSLTATGSLTLDEWATWTFTGSDSTANLYKNGRLLATNEDLTGASYSDLRAAIGARVAAGPTYSEKLTLDVSYLEYGNRLPASIPEVLT